MDHKPEKLETENTILDKMYKGTGEVFQEYLKRFKEYAKENPDSSTDIINNLGKISGPMGYTVQVHASLEKVYGHEKRLAIIEKRLARLSPDDLEKFNKADWR